MRILTTRIAQSLADLRPDTWAVVKTCRSGRWQSDLGMDEHAFDLALEAGRIVAVQRREDDGSISLLAKLPAKLPAGVWGRAA